MTHPNLKVMMTTVGSLVSQNFLEVLEYPKFRRREQVHLIGTNTIVSPNNFRCDTCYAVPPTSTDEFIPRMIEIIQKEEPDLILCGRDVDTEVLGRLKKDNPKLKGVFPYGELRTICYGLDKWETWLFTQKHGLPFASTFVRGESGGVDELQQFIDEFGYPLIAKPIRGFGSKGVFFVRNWEQARYVMTLKDYMFQEYLGDKENLRRYFEMMDGPTPLYAHTPNVFHHSCYTVIAPTGEMDRIFVTRNEHASGRTIGYQRVFRDELEALGRAYAEAYFEEGGYGLFSIQARQDRHGAWKVQEMNLRMTGNTFAKFLLGQDDFGLIVNAVLPELDFPVYRPSEDDSRAVIEKLLQAHTMQPCDMEQFQQHGVWERPSA